MALPGADLLPHLAGCDGALQADRPGCCLGCLAAAADHDPLQPGIRAPCWPAIGWCPLPHLHLYRADPLGIVRLCPDPVQHQPGLRPQPDHQDLFPPAGDPAFQCALGIAGFRHLLAAAVRHDVLLPDTDYLAGADLTFVRHAGYSQRGVCRPMAIRIERAVS